MGVDLSRVRRGERVALLGAAIAIVANFLPWGTLAATSPGVIYGYEGPGSGGMIGSFILVAMLVSDDYTEKNRLYALFMAVAVFGMAVLGLVDPTFFYARGPFAPTPAIGAFVGLVGGVLCLVGTILTEPVDRPDPSDDAPSLEQADA